MSNVRRSRKPPPEGWELIEPTLDEFAAKMREAQTDTHEGKRRTETLWPIFRIHHQRSRYIYDLFYKRQAISRELYEYCLNEKLADASLIAKWKKQGYENLCCLRCIQTKDTNFGTNCICRVPKTKLEESIYYKMLPIHESDVQVVYDMLAVLNGSTNRLGLKFAETVEPKFNQEDSRVSPINMNGVQNNSTDSTDHLVGLCNFTLCVHLKKLTAVSSSAFIVAVEDVRDDSD